MPTVHLRTQHVAYGPLDWTADERLALHRTQARYAFTVDAVAIEVEPTENRFTSVLAAELSDAAVASLEEPVAKRLIPATYYPEVGTAVRKIEDALDRLVDTLRFAYPMELLRGVHMHDLSWSFDGAEWMRALFPRTSVRLGSMSMRQVDDDSAPIIQAQLDAGVRPLLAFRHLQRAKDESDPRHQCIDATIAAELGIKEFLSRKAPAIAPLLLELPSPPLPKLYGKILEEYSDTPSPWRKQLIALMELRNALVHRHDQPSPDRQTAWNYVNVVAAALTDLMVRLYPDDQTLRILADNEARVVASEPKRPKG